MSHILRPCFPSAEEPSLGNGRGGHPGAWVGSRGPVLPCDAFTDLGPPGPAGQSPLVPVHHSAWPSRPPTPET